MSNQALFSLFSELLKDNENIKLLDFKKEEDLDKLKKSVKTIKENPFFSNFFDNEFLDDLVSRAEKIYEDAHPEKKTPVRPSTQVSEKIKDNVNNLAKDYINTMIRPYAPNIKEDQLNEIIDSLTEFGCWIYKK